MDYIRLYEEDHLDKLLALNELIRDKYLDYPYHSNWIDKAKDDIEIGKRIAFGAIFGGELVGSVIVKDGLSSDLELKNFIINPNIPEIDIEDVRDNLLQQVEIFAQRNDYEIFTTNILTKHLEDLNYFLSRNFTVSSLKQFPNNTNLNLYTLTKELTTVYNGDPLDFETIIDWILKRQYNFNIKSFEMISSPFGPIARCFKYKFTLKNSLSIKDYSITGEAVAIDFTEEENKTIDNIMSESINSFFSNNVDIKFVFDSRKLKKDPQYSSVNYFSKKSILKILGKESIPVKIPFIKSELGGALFYVDYNIKQMYFPKDPGLFPEKNIMLYLVDGYGSSLNNGDTIFFVEKDKDGSIKLLAKAEVSSIFKGNYNSIYSNLKGNKNNSFLKNNSNFKEVKDRYKTTYWNFLTSFHRTSKNRKSKSNLLIALALNKFVKLKGGGIEFLSSLTKSTRNFIDSDKKESFTATTYLNQHSVDTLKRKYFTINDVINPSKISKTSIKFSKPRKK